MLKTIINNFYWEKLLWIIRSRLLYMIFAALIGAVAGGGYAYASQASTYQAQITFYAYSKPDYVTDTGVNLTSADITQASSLLASYMQILNSAAFLEKVIEYAELENETVAALQRRIKAASVSNTAVFLVTVIDGNPQKAMTIANAIGDLAPAEIIRIVKSGGIEVLDEAELPTVPYSSTSITRYMMLGAAAGFLLVAAWALLVGLLDTTLRRRYELEALFTIPVLGIVPQLTDKGNAKADVVLGADSTFEYKEAYSDIRIKLLLSQKEETAAVYAVTSADCEEGKTVNACNLAIAFSNLGKKVLLIDADLRNSNMSQLLPDVNQHMNQGGLAEYLSGRTEKVNRIPKKDRLDVLLAGQLPENPAELLACDKWYGLLKEYKKEYDVIFIDLPALGIVSDALGVAHEVTAYILIVREFLTCLEREERIVRRLEEADAEICGFIYNGISAGSQDYKHKKYGKEYQQNQ